MVEISTTVRGIPIRIPGSPLAQRQLHAGIQYVSKPSIPWESQSGYLKDWRADHSLMARRISISVYLENVVLDIYYTPV